MDYSKFEQIAREEDAAEKRAKDADRMRNRVLYYKEQEERRQKWLQLQKDKGTYDPSMEAGHGHGHGQNHSHSQSDSHSHKSSDSGSDHAHGDGTHTDDGHSHSHGDGTDHAHTHGNGDGEADIHTHNHESTSTSSSTSSSSTTTNNNVASFNYRRPTCGCGFADLDQIKKWKEAADKQSNPRSSSTTTGENNNGDPSPVVLSEAEKLAKKIRAIEATREHGRQLFGEGLYEQAFAVFERGVLIINGIVGVDDQTFDWLQKNECILDVNMAACKLKLNEYTSCIDQCRMALNIDKQCVKAYFRMAQAYQAMGEFDQSRSLFEQALTFEQSKADEKAQVEIVRAIDKVKVLKLQQEEKAAREMKLMQERMKKAMLKENSSPAQLST